MKKHVPLILAAAFGVWALAGLWQPSSRGGLDLASWGRLPVMVSGRVQPIDSAARNALRVICGKQSLRLREGGRLSATEWLLETAMRPEQADQRQVFRVDHPDVRGLLGLPMAGGYYHSYRELEQRFDEIEQQARHAEAVEPANRSSFERAIIKLDTALSIYRHLKNSLRPEDADDFAAELADYQRSLAPGAEAMRRRQSGEAFDQQDVDRLARHLRRFEHLAQSGYVRAVPPAQTGFDRWTPVGLSLLESARLGEFHPALAWYAAMSTACRAGKVEDFNRAVAEYRGWLNASLGRQTGRTGVESVYNHWQPFYRSMVMYLLAFLLACASWFGWFQPLNRSARLLLVIALLLHSAGLAFRMFLEGRPPVTNLYSSAVFVGWGAVLLGLVLESFTRDGLGLAIAGAIGFLSQLIAHNLALGGDTMHMLRAVLDTNFWLATHVTTITLGYSANFVAGFLGLLYVLRGVFTHSLDATARAKLARVVYGVVCFATLFSFVGTVLGGIWADRSWGRFWGWDPKENGALIIVLWNALILHARWDGMVRQRGLMNLAIFGNVVTAFSWFGVNMLGVGLHAYGFMEKGLVWLLLFITFQLAVIGIGLTPEHHWASLRCRSDSEGQIASEGRVIPGLDR